MDIKQIAMVFVGVTLLYAGVLSLAEDLYVGGGMIIGGGALTVIPLRKAFVRFRSQSGGGGPLKTRKGKRKEHLRVVKREEEDRPTYH
jgi:hypothetical protein